MTCKGSNSSIALCIALGIVCVIGDVFLFGSVSFDRLTHSNANSLYWYQCIVGGFVFFILYTIILLQICFSAFELIVIPATIGAIVYSLPMVSMQYYIFARCSNGYMSTWDVGNLAIHMAILLFVSVIIILTMIFQNESSDRKTDCFCLLLHMPYFAAVTIVIVIGSITLSGAKLHSSYDPQYRNVSIFALPKTLLPNHPVTNYPIGYQLSEIGEETDDFVVVPSVPRIMNSPKSRVEVHTYCDSDGYCTTIRHEFRIHHTALNCNNLEPKNRPPSCNGNMIIVFEHYVKEYGGISYRVCGYKNPDLFEEDWTLRFLMLHNKDGPNGTLVTTPWQEVNSCGESKIKQDDDIKCPARASGLWFSAATYVTVLMSLTQLI